jgi:mono/diheme cytochrome c family protein
LKNKTRLVLLAIVLGLISFAFIQEKEWTAPPHSKQLKNPENTSSVASTEGAKIFKIQCLVCHGETGKGDGMVGMSLNPRPANLQSTKVTKQTDGEIYWKISTGNSPMPSYALILNEQQRWQLVNYIRKLELHK